MALFMDRRRSRSMPPAAPMRARLVDVVNPAEQARPSGMSQRMFKQYQASTGRVHQAVQAGHAAVISNYVPPVVTQQVARSPVSTAPTILPSFQSRGTRLMGALRTLDNRVLGRP